MNILCVLLMCLLLTACSPINSLQPFNQEQAALVLKSDYVTQPAQEKIEIALPDEENWKKINIVKNKKNLMFIPRDENVDSWKQSIRTQIIAYLDEPKISAKKMVLSEMRFAYNHCKQVKAMLIKQTASFVTYKLDMHHCDDQADQIQVGKIFNGVDAVYMVYYTALSNQTSSIQLQQMSEMIKTTQLVKADK